MVYAIDPLTNRALSRQELYKWVPVSLSALCSSFLLSLIPNAPALSNSIPLLYPSLCLCPPSSSHLLFSSFVTIHTHSHTHTHTETHTHTHTLTLTLTHTYTHTHTHTYTHSHTQTY